MYKSSRSSRPRLQGFTLVELSIVLVIIGLLVGGIMTGRALIKSGDLQSIISDYTKYKAAVDDFKKQYRAIPGDMIDATDYWGISTACAGASATGTCNGNGGSTIDVPAGASVTGEDYQVWRQLQLSGRITGTFSGTSGTGGASHTVAGTNAPKGRIAGGAWETDYHSSAYVGDATTYRNVNYGNYFRFGGISASGAANTPIIKPEDAWKLDTKIDDSRPNGGTIIASHWGTCANSASNDATASTTDAYHTDTSSILCTVYFINQY